MSYSLNQDSRIAKGVENGGTESPDETVEKVQIWNFGCFQKKGTLVLKQLVKQLGNCHQIDQIGSVFAMPRQFRLDAPGALTALLAEDLIRQREE